MMDKNKALSNINKLHSKKGDNQDLILLYRTISRIFINKMIKKQIKNNKKVKPWNV